ncbi:DNA-directed RNA polymerase II protein [Striga asiatica]|uniref:DNA-directed RNA polymerase II protein n=1 Tax=Striga asiatica TaxID=4170 RepID=A0A5A7PWG6_STRAF|nr:DNA-directed RNA polymerase II protein [Striga asiatica]
MKQVCSMSEEERTSAAMEVWQAAGLRRSCDRRAYLGRGLQPECAACREWPGALGTRRNLVHLGCPRISLPEIEVSSARGSPTRTTFSLPENWWPPSCRGR